MAGHDDEPTFSIEEGLAAQRALRDRLGLGPERFPLPAFVGMLSDEIEKMRAAGHDDGEVARVIASATGREIAPEALARHYAPPERRHPEKA